MALMVLISFLYYFVLFIGVKNFVKPSPGSCGEFNYNTEEVLHERHNESSVYCLK